MADPVVGWYPFVEQIIQAKSKKLKYRRQFVEFLAILTSRMFLSQLVVDCVLKT